MTWLAGFPQKNPMPVVEVDLAHGALHYVNPAAERLFPDLAGLGLRHPLLAGVESATSARTGRAVRPMRLEVAVGKNWYELNLNVFGRGRWARIYGVDITDRKKKEADLRRFNRTLMAHNQSSHAMMRATDESDYLSEVCRIIVEDCGHAMVWIGYAQDDEKKSVRPVASAGFERGYLATLDITWADNERGRGPTGTTIRTGKPTMCRNMLTDPRFAPWREAAIQRGYASSVVVPLKNDEMVFGAISIYSREADAFSPDEVELLANLADDVAFGISALRMSAAQRRSELALRESEERYRALVDAAPDAVIVHRDHLLLYANPTAIRLFGALSFEELRSRSVLELIPAEDREQARARIQRVARGEPLPPREARILRFDGQEVPVESVATPVEYGGARAVMAFFRDITARKEAEDARRKSEATLRGILNATQESVWLFDPEGAVLQANDIALARMGKTADEALGRKMDEVVDPALAQSRTAHLREVVESRLPVEFEDRRASYFFHHTFYPVFDADGKVSAVASFSRDVTERKRAEEALADSRRKYQALIETTSDFIWEIDAFGRYTYCSPQMEALWGLRPEEMIGKTSFDMMPPDARESAARFFRSLVETPRAFSGMELPSYGGQGRVIHIEASGVPFFDQNDKLLGFRGISRDVTQRKRAEEALRETRDYLESLFAYANAPIIVWDPELRITRFNHAFEHLTGRRAEEVVGQRLELLFPEETKQESLGHIRRAGAGERWEVVEIPIVRVDGSVRTVLWNSATIRGGDGTTVVATMAQGQDITERKLVEEQLRRAQELLETVTTGTEVIIAAVDTELRYTYFNKAYQEEMRRLTGRDLKIGTPMADLFAEMPDEQREAIGAWSRVLRGEGTTRTVEFGDPSRYRRIYRSMQTPIRDDGGDVVGAGEVAHDITRQVQTEQALRETRSRLESLKRAQEVLRAERGRLFGVLDQLPLFVYLRAPDHSVVFANRYFREEFGAPERKPCYETLGRRSTPCEGCDFARVFGAGETVDWDWTAPNGKEYQVHHYPFVDSDGTRLVLALGVDITERNLAFVAEKAARSNADALREVSLALSKNLDVDTVLLSLLDHLGRLVPFDRAKVMLHDGKDRVVVRAVLDAGGKVQFPVEPRPSFLRGENPVVEAILTTRESVLIPDIHEHPTFGPRVDPAFEHSWLGVPLVARGAIIGLYSLGKRDADSFTIEHQHLAEALSAQAAVALENALLFEQVQAASAQMQTLSRRLVDVQETERRTIARELHDEAGQSLTSILFGLRLLEKGLERNEEALGQISELKRTTNAVMEELHRLATDLRPASLEHLGLVSALRQHLARIESTSGLTVHFMARGLDDVRLPASVETTLFRIVQEALTNVLRHANATRVDVLAERHDNRVILVVEDDGVGFEAERPGRPESLGRVGMRERAEALGGTFTIESSPGAGTTVAVEVPYGDSNPDR